MRIVFLDFDGVLNSELWNGHVGSVIRDAHCHVCAEAGSFDPRNVRRLNRITEATGASIVVSSSWRHMFPSMADMRHLLRAAGVDGRVIGRTPLDGARVEEHNRGLEIKYWLDSTGYRVLSFVILDDVDEFQDFGSDRWIQTGWATGGLLDEHTERAIEMLGGQRFGNTE